ncbi:MAG: hypothetical protein HFF17_10955 [Oscillospiraceae bacterium]|nr:hypothetical protein [Oscillospiraceae bacterium]
MNERRRLNLSLSMAIPHQREAWKVLRSIPPGQRTDAVCRMICRSKEQNELLDSFRTILQEELRRNRIISTENQGESAGGADENVLGFLLSLQNDGGEE